MVMRVLHTEWSDAWGGQEMRVLQDLKTLRASGMEVFLATPPNTSLSLKAQAMGIMVLPASFRRTIDIASFLQVYKAIKKYRIDIVNTHSGKDTWMAGLAACLAGAAFVRTQHFIKPRRWYRSHRIYRYADHVITTGEAVKQDIINLCHLLPERVTSIPSCPDHRHFNPQRFDRVRQRTKLGLSDTDIAIGTLSRVSEQKGIREFLYAVEPLLRQYPQLQVYVAGEGELVPESQEHVKNRGIADRVHFLGFLDDPAEYLAALDVFVLPSYKEGLPQSLLQALLMGIPAVATRVGSIQELGNDAILLIEPRDNEALFEALNRMITDAEMRFRMAGNARRIVQDRYTEDIMRDSTVALYRRLLA